MTKKLKHLTDPETFRRMAANKYGRALMYAGAVSIFWASAQPLFPDWLSHYMSIGLLAVTNAIAFLAQAQGQWRSGDPERRTNGEGVSLADYDA